MLPLERPRFARVTELDLHGKPITDAGLAWLADPATGLTRLATLDIGNTKVTDAGAKTLASGWRGSVQRPLPISSRALSDTRCAAWS
jgi:hypothetical protein